MARRARDYARRAFNWAIDRQLLDANPFARVVLEGRLVSRDRVLTDAELGAAWRAAGAMDYPFGPLLQLLILTLQRRGEVAGMRWSELAPDLSSWMIPASRAKNRKQHLIHLAEPARAVLRGLPRIHGQDRLFTTTGKTTVSGFQNAAEALRRGAQRTPAAGAEAPPGDGADKAAQWRLHDFRRTGVTALARLGVQPHVADRLLNHVAGVMRGGMAVYQRYEFLAERQAALEIWAAHVLAVASDTPMPANVVSIAGRKKKRMDKHIRK
jgi:integrase